MDETKLDRLLIAALSGGAPLDEDALLPIVVESCNQHQEREDAESEGIGYVLTEHLTSHSLLSVDWESWGAPTSSSDSLRLLSVEANIYLCTPPNLDELHSFLVLAAIPAADGPAGISGMVLSALPQLFGDVWPPRLPTSTSNLAPGLLDGQVVKRAYRSMANDPKVWQALLVDLAELVSLRGSVGQGSEQPLSLDRDLAGNGRAATFHEWFVLTYQESER